MDKREKIIVAVASLALLYGAYDRLLAGKSGPAGQDPKARLAEVRAGVDEAIAKSAATRPGEMESYVVAGLQRPWGPDPFYAEAPTLNETAALVPDKGVTFSYTGYIEVAGETFAVINGLEHRTGDLIVGTRYSLASIRPGWIEITDDARTGMLQVPYEEETAGPPETPLPDLKEGAPKAAPDKSGGTAEAREEVSGREGGEASAPPENTAGVRRKGRPPAVVNR